jgi:two-component system response regulator HydG
MALTYDTCVILDQDEVLYEELLKALKSIPVDQHCFSSLTADGLNGVVSHTTIVIQLGKDNDARIVRFNAFKTMFPEILFLPLFDCVDAEMAKNIILAKIDDPLFRKYFLDLIGIISGVFTPIPSNAPVAHEFMMGADPNMQKIYRDINLVARTDYSVILFGETGTGKESLAHMVHRQSKRRAGPFVTVDCGCLNRDIAASELFGHVKGAFTDAFSDKTGAFEMADGGTLFLDEIANMPYDVQIALLRALQEHKIRKVGSAIEKNVNVRIIAATNEDLPLLVSLKTFRQDLYYRLNEMTIQLPPLRERKEDVTLFTNAFVASISNSIGKKISGLTAEATNLIKTYSWPGNVRELKNVLKHACLLTSDGTAITADVLPISVGTTTRAVIEEGGGDLRGAVSLAERDRIFNALRMADYNKKKAAELLNIHRKTLYNKLKALEYIPK